MKNLTFLLALAAIFSSPTVDAAEPACKELRDAVAVWKAANSIFDAVSGLNPHGEEARDALLEYAGASTGQAREVADAAAMSVTRLRSEGRLASPNYRTMTFATAARTRYRKLADDLLANGGTHMYETLLADRKVTAAYYAIVLAVQC